MKLKVNILVENRTQKRGYAAEHGLAMLIEADNHRILFDTGQTDLLLRNAALSKVDLSAVDALVISHGHYDHAGGVPAFCSRNSKARIYIHPDAFRKRYNATEGRPTGADIGMPWDTHYPGIAERLVLTRNPCRLADRILVSGTIPVGERRPERAASFVWDHNGIMAEDHVPDEQCLCILGARGLYLFVGCSHPGIGNILAYAEGAFENRRCHVTALAGGLHLGKADLTEVKRTVHRLSGKDISRIIPLHCTGLPAVGEMMHCLGERCIPASAGDEIILEDCADAG